MFTNLCNGFAIALLFCRVPAVAAQIPADTILEIRLTTKVASELTTAQPVKAVVIAPVFVDGAIVVAPGVELSGEAKQAKAANDKDPAQLQLLFTEMRSGTIHVAIKSVVASLENARESVDATGLIQGIAPGETYSARLNQGIAKLEQNDRLAGLAGLIQTAKKELKIEDANPNIDYDPGTELTVRLTQPVNWPVSDPGPLAHLQSFPNENSLPDLVNRQPFRTVAENPPRPSDLTNLMFVATEAELKAAFEKAGWSSAARLSTRSKLETARALIEARGYKEGPMSVLLLDGRPPDFAFQKGNNTFAMRHHLRIFRRPETFDGKPVWVCSSTHDTGIDFSERDRTFIHKVDSEIDKERAKVVNDLLFAGAVRSLALVDRDNVPTNISNATGDSLRTDGRMAVLLLQ